MRARQISILPETDTERSAIVVLGENGSIYVMSFCRVADGSGKWIKLPDLPEDK